MLRQLRQRVGLTRLVNQLVSEGSVIAIRVLDKSMITVDYAEKRDDKLPEPTEIELRESSQARARRANRKLFGSVSAKRRGSDRSGGRRTKRRSDSGYTPYGSSADCYSNGTRLAMGVSGLVLLFGSMIAIFGANKISRPIVDLTEMTRRIAGGDFTQRIAISARNEIGALAASFNEMTRRLNESIEHLKETTAAKERIKRVQIAHEIQMSMVPKIFPPFPTGASSTFSPPCCRPRRSVAILRFLLHG